MNLRTGLLLLIAIGCGLVSAVLVQRELATTAPVPVKAPPSSLQGLPENMGPHTVAILPAEFPYFLPGDRVDLLLIADEPRHSKVVAENLLVLAVDRSMDNPTSKASVTLAVSEPQTKQLAVLEREGTLRPIRRR